MHGETAYLTVPREFAGIQIADGRCRNSGELRYEDKATRHTGGLGKPGLRSRERSMMPPLSEAGDQSCQPILAPIAPGELVDKISILEIKSERIKDRAKCDNVRIELAALLAVRDMLSRPHELASLT